MPEPVRRSSFIAHRCIGILALFFAARVPLLIVRRPFFDELFTRWIAAKPFGGILQALQHDSGPPLYYFIVHLFGHPRVLSLIFATVALGALLYARAFAAAALVAVFAPAVLFAVDGRSYALCAMFVTMGVLALDRERPYCAAAAFVLAAYSHYYGALFFPLVRKLKPAVLYALFLPGLWLAVHQPRGAIGWMQRFAYPDALFARPPIALLVLMIALVAAAAFRGAPAPSPANNAGGGGAPWSWSLIPYVVSLPIYVPLRFESVVATPLMLWLSSARRVVVFGLAACFATWTAMGIVDHVHRPPDDYHAAAAIVARAPDTVVASGYLYLETVMLRPSVIAFPPEQAQHPGWRATAMTGSGLPPGAFVWVGERNAPELAIIRQTRTVQPLYVNARAMIARVR